MWQKKGSKKLFTHKRMNIIEDDITLHNGEESTYLRIEFPGNAAAIIPVQEDEKILLQKEYTYPLNNSLYQFPGGVVPHGEESKAGALRELTEETGLHANNLVKIGFYYAHPRRSDAKTEVYIAKDLVGKFLPGDTEEIIEIFWFTQKEIDEMIAQGEISDSGTLASWSLYKAYTSNTPSQK